MKARDDHVKWFAQSEYVDIDTGEVISKSEYIIRNYRKLKTHKTYNKHENSNTGTIKYTIEVQQHEQYRLEWGD